MRARFFFILILPLLFLGCDLETPASIPVALPGEETLPNLPFHSKNVFALAWHPDGQRLAVGERAGAKNLLRGLTLNNPRVHDLRMSFPALRRFAAIPARRLIVGETEDGGLHAWSLEDGSTQLFFSGPIAPTQWSLSESGEDLIYVPARSESQRTNQVRYVDLRTTKEKVLLDSAQISPRQKIALDGKGVWIAYEKQAGNLSRSRLAFYSLPEGQALYEQENVRAFAPMAASPDGRRLAFMKLGAAQPTLMIHALQQGVVDSVAIRMPYSDMIWLRDSRWLAMFHQLNNSSMHELRAYNLQDKYSVVLAQNLPFIGSEVYGRDLLFFSLADTLLFLTRSPERISVYDRRDDSFTIWFEYGGDGGLRSLEWTTASSKLFIHERTRAGKSVLHLGVNTAWQRYPQDLAYKDVSLSPDENYFLGVSPGSEDAIVKEGLLSSRPEILWRSAVVLEAVRAHPQEKFASIIESRYDPIAHRNFSNLRILDLTAKILVDSLRLPGESPTAFEWLRTPDELAGIFSARREGGLFPRGYEYDCYYLSLKERRFISAYRYGGTAFCVVPYAPRFSVLREDTLLTLQLQTSVP